MNQYSKRPVAAQQTGHYVASGLLSAASLVMLVGGGAWALWHWGRLDVWAHLSWADVWQVPDDGSVLLGVLTIIGWLAWLLITVAVISEAVPAVSHGRHRPHLVGVGWLRPVIGALVISVAGLVVAAGGGVRVSTPLPPSPNSMVAETAGEQDQSANAATAASVRPYLVQSGDDLWSLADRFAGGGHNWRVIADANATAMLDPSARLTPGSLLMVPSEPTPALNTITVKHGDTLWGLAGEYLGDPARWHDLYNANSKIISNPRMIFPGQVLVLPDHAAAPEKILVDQRHAPTTDTPEEPTGGPTDNDVVELPPLAGTLIETSRPPAETPANASDPPMDQASESEPVSDISSAEDSADPWLVALIGSIGAGLAGALLSGVALHRLIAQRRRPIGRTLPRVHAETQRTETALDKRAAQKSPSIGAQASRHSVARVILGFKSDGEEVSCDIAGAGLIAITGPAHQTQGLMAAMASQLLSGSGSDSPEVVLGTASLGWLGELFDCPVTPSDEAWQLVNHRQIHAVDKVCDPLVVFLDASTIERPSIIDVATNVTVVMSASAFGHNEASAIIELIDEDDARLWPNGSPFRAQLILPPARRALQELVNSLTGEDYPPAPWWEVTGEAMPDGAPSALRVVEGNTASTEVDAATESGKLMFNASEPAGHPRLMLLGPVCLEGAKGVNPSRAIKQCEEYCGWLLRYPGQTAVTMARSLLVAEGTRRSNMSRLRIWLGSDGNGQPYLPEAYSGRIRLHPGVTSDWEAAQVLMTGGVDKAKESALTAVLHLVRGAPLADAAPGQWHWAEEWRCDMVSLIRDVGVVLANLALDRRDIDLARWAAARALTAAPEDELLMMARLRTEYLAGNRMEVERLAFQITRTAKTIGFDLSDEMVLLLQQVIEGAPRVRLAS